MAQRSVNMVILLGTLGKDAETKFTQSGTAVTNFSMATNRNYKDKSGEWKTETDWHNVVAWRAEKVAEYLLKGTRVHVTGRLQTRSWEGQDGNKRYITEIVADGIILLGSKQDGDRQQQPRSAPRQSAPAQQSTPFDDSYDADPDYDDQIPF